MKRVTRTQYWIIQLLVLPLLIALVAVIGYVAFPVNGHELDYLMYGIGISLFALGIIVINLLTIVRRLNDAGKSPFWLIATFVPAVSFIAWFVIGVLPTKDMA